MTPENHFSCYLILVEHLRSQGRIQELSKGGGWRARRVRAYLRGLGRSPYRGLGAEPLVRKLGMNPLKLKAF